jgi:hypothetical protein
MKKLSFTKIRLSSIVLIISVSTVLFSSCEKQKMDEGICIDNELNKPSFIVQDGILMFKSTDSFFETLGSISNLSDEDRRKWEEKVGFLSQRRIINQIIDEEAKLDIINEARYAGKENPDYSNVILHTDIYYRYLDKGVIKLIDEGTENEYWDYAVINRCYVDFINEDGLYAIGNTLYQITESMVKSMKNIDFPKKSLLMQASATDEVNNITILLDKNDKTYPGCPGLITQGWTSSSDKRIKIELFLDVYYFVPASSSYSFFHEVYVQCQEKNWLGNWKYKIADIDVDGSWQIELFYNSQSYGNDYTFNGSASYLKSSINPSSGIPAPYQSYFSVTATYPDIWGRDEDYPPSFINYHWTALRNGGCCGLTSRLDKW